MLYSTVATSQCFCIYSANISQCTTLSRPSSVNRLIISCPSGDENPSGMWDLNGRKESVCSLVTWQLQEFSNIPGLSTFWKIVFYLLQLEAWNLFFVFHVWKAQLVQRFGQRQSFITGMSLLYLFVLSSLHINLHMVTSYQSTVVRFDISSVSQVTRLLLMGLPHMTGEVM